MPILHFLRSRPRVCSLFYSGKRKGLKYSWHQSKGKRVNTYSLAGTDKGAALSEFAIAAPFLLIFSAALIDIAGALNQYTLLTNAVHAGVRMLSSTEQLQDFPGPQPCSQSANTQSIKSTAQVSTQQQAPVFDPSQEQIEKRVEELVTFQNNQVDINSLCIASGLEPGDKDVKLHIEAKYNGYFPGFSGITIAVEAKGPHLY